MSITKYRVSKFSPITEVVVEKETESSVWVNGRRNAKQTSYEGYFESREAAKAWRVREAEQDVKEAEARVAYAKNRLADALKAV